MAVCVYTRAHTHELVTYADDSGFSVSDQLAARKHCAMSESLYGIGWL